MAIATRIANEVRKTINIETGYAMLFRGVFVPVKVSLPMSEAAIRIFTSTILFKCT